MTEVTQPRVYRLSGGSPPTTGTLHLDMSPEWASLYFPVSERGAVVERIPAGHRLHVRALRRRSFRVGLYTQHDDPTRRVKVWSVEVHGTRAQLACLFALRKHAPLTTVTVDDEDYVRDIGA